MTDRLEEIRKNLDVWGASNVDEEWLIGEVEYLRGALASAKNVLAQVGVEKDEREEQIASLVALSKVQTRRTARVRKLRDKWMSRAAEDHFDSAYAARVSACADELTEALEGGEEVSRDEP